MPKTTKSTNKKKTAIKTTIVPGPKSGVRRLKPPKQHLFRRNKIKIVHKKLPAARLILINSLFILKKYWKLFAIILVIYGLLNLLFVHGLSNGTNLNNLKTSLNSVFKGTGGKIVTSVTLFVYLVGGSNNSTTPNSAGVYQTILLVVFSLVIIWALRQSYNQKKIRAREAFYRGTSPLIQFILVSLVMILQLIPLLIGALIFTTVMTNGIAATGAEEIFWGAIFALLAAVSFYMLTSSIFALYAVTLPDMTPMKALRSARLLVRYRRLTIIKKILFFIICLGLMGILIMVPFLFFATIIAGWVFFVLSIIYLLLIHSYLYALYRELINE